MLLLLQYLQNILKILFLHTVFIFELSFINAPNFPKQKIEDTINLNII